MDVVEAYLIQVQEGGYAPLQYGEPIERYDENGKLHESGVYAGLR
jgi:hypothetical protein